MAQSVQVKDRTSNANLSVNSDGSLNATVSGTVTATPTGTQVVSGTVTTVPSGTQTVSGTVTTVPSGTQTVTGTVTATPTGTQAVSGTLGTYPAINPSLTGAYVFNLPDQTGVVAANNYLSVFNPVASGKTLVLIGGSMACYLGNGASNVEVSVQAFRITAATVGTLQAASAICKFQTAYANPVAEVRTGNPTVTVGAPFASLPPVIQPSTNNFVYQIMQPPGAGAFTLAAGEGVVFRTTSGDTDEQYNFNIVWGEF